MSDFIVCACVCAYVTIQGVAVTGRNRTLFRCVFQPHYRVQSTVVQNSIEGGAHTRYINLSGIHASFTVHMSTNFNGSFALQRFEHGIAVELHNGILYSGYFSRRSNFRVFRGGVGSAKN